MLAARFFSVGFLALLIMLPGSCSVVAQQAATVPPSTESPATKSPTSEPAPNPDDIDQRLVFLTVQLSTVESSIAATDKALKQKGYLKIAKEEAAEQARQKSDRKGSGPVLWQEFYGVAVEKIYFRPKDGTTIRVKATAVAARPPRIDYINQANEENRARAEADAAEVGNKIEDLLEYRRQLETEQSALWMKIAFRGVSSQELSTRPIYSLELAAPGEDEPSKQLLDAASSCVAFVKAIDLQLAAAQKGMDDPQGTLANLAAEATAARTELQSRLLSLSSLAPLLRDAKQPIWQFSRSAKAIDDLAQNLADAYRLAEECDAKEDIGGKRRYRGQVQQLAVDLATTLVSADQALLEAVADWKIVPVTRVAASNEKIPAAGDAIPAKLDAAKVAHQAEIKAARKNLVSAIDVRLNAAADAGNLAAVQMLQSAKFKAGRDGSVGENVIDASILAAKKSFDQAVAAANAKLVAAHKLAIAEYTKARKIPEAVAVQEELVALGFTEEEANDSRMANEAGGAYGPANIGEGAEPGAVDALADGGMARPVLAGERLEVEVPAPIDEIVAGGNGKYLVLHLKKLRQLALFDVSQAKVLKYLPMPSSEITYAVGSKKLFVGVKDLKRIQRWDLEKQELELTQAAPEGGVGALAIGAASLGPVVMIGEDKAKKFWIMNPMTLKCESFPSKNWGDERGAWGPLHVHVSFDGSTSVACGGGWAGIELASLKGNKVTRVQAGAYVNGDATIAGNGSLVFPDGGGIIRADLTSKVTGIDGTPFPAADPSFSVAHRKDSGKSSLVVYANSDPRPLVTLRDLPELDQESKLPIWQRVQLIPAAKVLVTLGEGSSSLVMRGFDLARELEAEGIDYLFVESSPLCQANRGQRYSYKMQVRSKKGGVKIKLQSGPKGMTVSKDGMVSWTVPARATEENASVIIEVTDATGQTIFHTFNIETVEATPRRERN